jgi:3-hydroxyacyl-CoA dehydrogenase
MTQSAPALPASGVIAVAPSSLGNAAAAVIALSTEARAQRILPIDAGVVGDARCGRAMNSASRLVAEALAASAHSLDELARALGSAAGAYGLADLVAVGPDPG